MSRAFSRNSNIFSQVPRSQNVFSELQLIVWFVVWQITLGFQGGKAQKPLPGDDEPLHVLVSGDTEEALVLRVTKIKVRFISSFLAFNSHSGASVCLCVCLLCLCVVCLLCACVY